MPKKRIIVTIDATGKTSLKVEGIKGTSCVALTEDLLNELGAVVTEKKTSEYYQQTVSVTSPVHSK